VAGATYQGVFRNPLADPYLLGVAAGSGLGAVLAFILPLPREMYGAGAVQLFAFLGGIVAVVAVYLLARVGGSVPTTTLLLAGVAISAAASAVTAYLMYLRGDQLLVIYSWLLGGFNVASWQEVRLIAPMALLSAALMTAGGRVMNAMQFGDEQAATLGVPVEPMKLLLLAAATLATAAAVSSAGLIGFVGLVVPHLTRLAFGPDYRRLVPLAALMGAAFLILADAAARSTAGPSEVPVGVITAAVGAPFFLVLLRRQKRIAFW
jgi:iron complex transport system permease protein